MAHLEINSMAEVHLFGQELNGETFAICKSNLYIKNLCYPIIE
jgi:type I restriction enzyme M protein